MPATARLRVNGAITSRLGRVIGPSLKGARSLVGGFILLSSREMTGERQMVSFITAAMPRAIHDTQVSRARRSDTLRYAGGEHLLISFASWPGFVPAVHVFL